ncbi:DNA-binding protein HU [Ascidiaceihabitans donghaensis]|uniref:DNA-binding protein HU n=2 Tax=Ascidiaceihabitans donghaensis TaxID=1510460 RepID=A0A2R8BDC2_9RHOB|nr:DNA-binding protein HU [Ascidiaceihabitans donghaensis]
MTSTAKASVKKTTSAKPAAKKTTKAASTKTASASAKTKSATPAKTSVDKTAAVTASAPTAAPVVVESLQTVVSGPAMRKRELIDLVVEKSGIKKKDAKPVIEAMLAVLGEAVSDGRELNLQPFGKVKVRRAKEMPNARVMVTKIRQSINTVPEAAE